MSAVVALLTAWLAENAGRIAATLGLRAFGGWLLRKARALRKRLPPKAFMTPEEYFRPYLSSSARTLIRHDVKLVERDQDVAKLMKGITNLEWPIVIVVGAPGQGKSRFALELARSIGTDRRPARQRLLFRGQVWKTYFVNTGLPDVLSHVATLPRRHPIALFVDDAPNSPQLARSLAEYASASADSQPLALVFTSRAYLLPTILDAMPQAFLGRVHSLKLNRLSVDGIGRIFDELVPKVARTDRNRFVQLTKDSPFLAVLLCDAIRSGVSLAAQLSDEHLRRQLCDEPIEKATSECGVALSKVRVALAGISAVAPYERRNMELKEAVRNLAGLNDAEFDCIVQAALESGLFIEYGAARVRPAPDLVGDLILDRVLISDTGDAPSNIAERIMGELLPIAPERVLSNMADLGWTKGYASVDLITPVLQRYKEQALSLSVSELHELLERLQPIAVRRPEAVLDIIETLWARIRDTASLRDESMREWRRLLGDAMPALEGAAYAEKGLLRSMVLVKELYTNTAVDTGYDNHKPLNVLVEMAGFSPYRSLELTATAMSELERWFQQGGTDAVVALESLDQVLSSTVNWTESGVGSVTLSSQVLLPNEEVAAIRDRAVALVERGILSNDAKLCEHALAAVHALGKYRFGPGFTADSPMGVRIKNEQLRLSKTMERIVTEGRTNRVMRQVEKCLWNWWCFADQMVADRSAELLRRIPSDPAYQISKGIFGSDIPLGTLVPEPETIGTTNRAEYFFREGHEFSVAHVDSVLSRLGLNGSSDKWATFLRGIAVGEGPTSWRARGVFEAIARRAPAAALSLATDYQDEPWSSNSDVLLSTVRVCDNALWRSKLKVALDSPQLSEDLAFTWLASLDWQHEFDEAQTAFVDRCLAAGSARLTKLVLDRLVYGVGFSWEDSIRKLFHIAASMPEDIGTLDQIYSKLAHRRGQAAPAPTISDVDKEALRYLLSLPMDSGIPWREPYWVGAYLKFIAEHYPMDFLGFFRGSLAQTSPRSSSYLHILGAKNAEEPIKVLLKGPLRKAHLVALFEMASEDKVSGVLVRAVFRSVLPVTDLDFQLRVEKALNDGRAIGVARVLSGYRFSLEWLELCKKTLVAAERLGLEHFERAANDLRPSFWEGLTGRSVGQPSERDRQISLACTDLSGDNTLPPRCRDFFRRCKEAADKSIDQDLKSDETLFGDRL